MLSIRRSHSRVQYLGLIGEFYRADVGADFLGSIHISGEEDS